MSVTLIGLIIYFIFLTGFAIFSSFAIYHLWKFGFTGDLSKPIAIGYLFISGVIIFFTLIYVLISLVGG